MQKQQYIAVASALVLFLLLYFVFDTIPPKQKSLEKSRALNIETTSVTNLIKEASGKLDKNQLSIIEAINLDLQKAGNDTIKKIGVLKSLSGTWYDMGHPAIAGSFAEEIATISKDEESWSVTGTTYAICVKNSQD
jgi:hypothetical protein